MTFLERLGQAIAEVISGRHAVALDPRTFFDVKLTNDRSVGDIIEVDWRAELKHDKPDFGKKRPIAADGVAVAAPGQKAEIEVLEWEVGGVTIPKNLWHNNVRGEWEAAIEKDVRAVVAKLASEKKAEVPPPLPKAAPEEPPPLPSRTGYPESLRQRLNQLLGEV